jgi:FkbM family methyltransferase
MSNLFSIGSSFFSAANRRMTALKDFVIRFAPSEFLGHISFVREMKRLGVKIDIVLDIGAHSGRWTKWISRAVGIGAKYHLIEPQTKFADRLSKLGTYYPFLLSDELKDVNFYSIGGTGDSYLREVSVHYQDLKPKKILATPLRKVPGIPTQIDLVKIDTQGSELDILRGFGEIINSVKLVILEVPLFSYNSGAPSFTEYLSFMEANRFIAWRIVHEHKVDHRLLQVDIGFVSLETVESFANIKKP